MIRLEKLRDLRGHAIGLGIAHIRAAINPVTAGASVLCRSDAGAFLLVCSRLTRNWGLPGGAIDRGETPVAAALRELHEETGHSGGSAPSLFGIYTRRAGLVTNLIAVYQVEGGSMDFRPSYEVIEAGWFAPQALPQRTNIGARRRIAECSGAAPKSPYW